MCDMPTQTQILSYNYIHSYNEVQIMIKLFTLIYIEKEHNPFKEIDKLVKNNIEICKIINKSIF